MILPKKLPDGSSRKFIPNVKEPRKDITVVSAETAIDVKQLLHIYYKYDKAVRNSFL